MKTRYTDDDEAHADYEAEMARDGADDWDSLTLAQQQAIAADNWDSLTADQQQAIIDRQEAAAWVAAERRAEIPMSRDLWRGF